MTATAAWQEKAGADPSFCAERVAEREANRRRAAAIDLNRERLRGDAERNRRETERKAAAYDKIMAAHDADNARVSRAVSRVRQLAHEPRIGAGGAHRALLKQKIFDVLSDDDLTAIDRYIYDHSIAKTGGGAAPGRRGVALARRAQIAHLEQAGERAHGASQLLVR